MSSYPNSDRSQPWMYQDSIAWLTLIGRVPPGSLPAAQSRLRLANHEAVVALAATFSDTESRQEMAAHQLAVDPFSRGFSGLRSRFGDALFALTAMVILVLFVTCTNIANLLLARATTQEREIRIRTALGATPSALIRQYLTESMLLAVLGGIAGLAIGHWGSQWLASAVLDTPPTQLPPVFSFDGRVLAFTALVTGVVAMVFGLVPAWRAIRANSFASPGTGARQGLATSTMRSMRPLVAAQFAMSCVVVIAAGLFGRTLITFSRLDLGFDTAGVVTVTINPVTSGFTRDQLPAMNDRVVSAITSVPGVVAAALSACAMGANCTSRVDMGRDATPVGRMAQLHNAWVGPGYFDAIGARQLSGRGFTERDTAASPRVAVISAAVASRYFPGQTAVGRHVLFQQLDTEIVGVVADMRGLNLRESPAPVIYVPVAQPSAFTPAASSLEVRVSGDPSRAVLPIQDAIRRAEPALIVDNVRTMNQRLDRALTRERLVAYLSSVFGLLTLLLACTGLYGVLSYSVARRATEIGVRAALGAGPGRLAWMVMADALYIVVPGVVVGVSTALSLRRLLNTLLFGVTASDPSTYVVATALLSVVALVAVYLPARRAAQADPMHALRAE